MGGLRVPRLWGFILALFKKKKKTAESAPDEDILSVLKEIRDKLTTRDEQDYSAILSGIVSSTGPTNGGEDTAKSFAEFARCLIGQMRSK